MRGSYLVASVSAVLPKMEVLGASCVFEDLRSEFVTGAGLAVVVLRLNRLDSKGLGIIGEVSLLVKMKVKSPSRSYTWNAIGIFRLSDVEDLTTVQFWLSPSTILTCAQLSRESGL